MLQRLYAIGRADLPPGLRAAQIGHALIAWTAKHGETCDNLVLVQARDEAALTAILTRLRAAGHVVEAFYEPDLDGQLTAIAAHPDAWRFSSLPLFR